MRVQRFSVAFLLSLLLIACGPGQDRGPVDIAVIGEEGALFETGVRLSPAAQHLRGASHEGLVALDQSGQVVPALAERWIVTDDAMSYIFRLRNSGWPDEEPMTAPQIRLLLQQKFRQFEGTSLGLDLAKIIEVRAMTGRVIELRLSGPMPDFLRLLAQPELGLDLREDDTGPMVAKRDEEDSTIIRLTMLPPEQRGFPARENWEDGSRDLLLRSLPASEAVDAFSRGEFDLLLNGSLLDFPTIELGPLSRGAVQLDPALGLFGLIVRSDAGLLETASVREALSMAIDRDALIQPFGLGGWACRRRGLCRPSCSHPMPFPAIAGLTLTMDQQADDRQGTYCCMGRAKRLKSLSFGSGFRKAKEETFCSTLSGANLAG